MEETLIKSLSQATGLEASKIESILKQWIMDQGRSPQSLSLEDLREVLVPILQDLFSEVADGHNPYISLSD